MQDGRGGGHRRQRRRASSSQRRRRFVVASRRRARLGSTRSLARAQVLRKKLKLSTNAINEEAVLSFFATLDKDASGVIEVRLRMFSWGGRAAGRARAGRHTYCRRSAASSSKPTA